MKDRHFRLGIRFRMVLGLLLVFLASAGLLSLLLNRQMKAQLTADIREDMMRVWQDVNLYSRQLLMTGGFNNDEEGFRQVSRKLAEVLPVDSEWSAYTLDGQNLEGTDPRAVSEEPKPTLGEMQTADCRVILEGEQCRAEAMLPVIVADKTLGWVQVVTDYSGKRQSQTDLLRLVMRWTAVALLAAMVLSILIMNQVVRPILSLSALSREITGMVDAGQMENLPGPARGITRRRDEIGELAGNYRHMIDTIGEQFRKEQRDQERILELMHSRQIFFDNATHELKTPLTTIQGYAQLIRADEGEDRELFTTGMDHILKESERLHSMVLQLLDLSDQREPEERQPLILSEAAHDVAAAMQLKAARYGNSIHEEYHGDCSMTGQKNRLRQLMINLLDNAIKYGRENHPILVRIDARERELVLSVANYGESIPEEQREKIFEPFYRVDKQSSRELGSSGLGLAICRKIAEDHGGSICVKSGASNTVVFIVHLSRESGVQDRQAGG